jgi:hypothetical protein
MAIQYRFQSPRIVISVATRQVFRRASANTRIPRVPLLLVNPAGGYIE